SGQDVRKNRVYENVIVSKVGASNCNAASYIRHESVDGVAEASAQCCCIIDVHCMLISPGQSSRMTGTVEVAVRPRPSDISVHADDNIVRELVVIAQINAAKSSIGFRRRE